MKPKEFKEIQAYLAANFVVHFIERLIPEEKVRTMTVDDLLKLAEDTANLFTGETELKEYKSMWGLK